MKTIRIITALLFSIILGLLFGSASGLPAYAIVPFITIGTFIAAYKLEPGLLLMGFALTEMDDPLPPDNMGGILSYIYVALAEDIETWPTEPDIAIATMDDVQVLTGALVCKTGKNFFKIKLEPEKCSIASEDVGSKGGISQKHVLKIYKGDMSAKFLGFIRATNNQEFVIEAPDANGRMIQIGSEKFPARKMPEGNAGTGEGPEGESGVAITFVSYGNGPAYILDSSIPVPTTPQGS